ncbi:hypothetical protein LCGC14_1192900, partial [marine sediment metagenome]
MGRVKDKIWYYINLFDPGCDG